MHEFSFGQGLRGVVQFTFYWRAEPTKHYWLATNPALPARSLLLRERYYASEGPINRGYYFLFN
jgi:hypothetical protein